MEESKHPLQAGRSRVHQFAFELARELQLLGRKSAKPGENTQPPTKITGGKVSKMPAAEKMKPAKDAVELRNSTALRSEDSTRIFMA
jgi:hypothetical protein